MLSKARLLVPSKHGNQKRGNLFSQEDGRGGGLDHPMDNRQACVTSSAADAIGLVVPRELDEVHLSVLDAKTLNMQARRMPAVGTMYYCGSYPDRCHPY